MSSTYTYVVPPRSETAQYYACKHMLVHNYIVSSAQLFIVVASLPMTPSRHTLCCPLTPTDPLSPRNVTITRVFEDGVELNWLPPTEPNGEVHYVIEYKREDSGSWTSVNTTSDSTHYNLTGLHSGTNYTIRVVAVNSAGRTPMAPTSSSAATPTSNNIATPTPSSTGEEDNKETDS